MDTIRKIPAMPKHTPPAVANPKAHPKLLVSEAYMIMAIKMTAPEKNYCFIGRVCDKLAQY